MSTGSVAHRATFSIKRAAIIVGVCLVFSIAPYWNHMTLWFLSSMTDQSITALAAESHMTPKAKIMFYQMQPELVSDSEMQQVCAENTKANNDNGFIEQGCYVPNASDPSTGKIYIREMHDDFHEMEATTATYELLHPIYFAQASDGDTTALDKEIEKNYQMNRDSNLDEQVANFAVTEPEYRELELFSILGTEYSNITDELMSYYTPYFDDNLTAVVAMSNSVFDEFDRAIDLMIHYKTQAENYETLAKSSTNYSEYSQYLDTANTLIDQYNAILDRVNTLIAEFRGTQPINESDDLLFQQQ